MTPNSMEVSNKLVDICENWNLTLYPVALPLTSITFCNLLGILSQTVFTPSMSIFFHASFNVAMSTSLVLGGDSIPLKYDFTMSHTVSIGFKAGKFEGEVFGSNPSHANSCNYFLLLLATPQWYDAPSSIHIPPCSSSKNQIFLHPLWHPHILQLSFSLLFFLSVKFTNFLSFPHLIAAQMLTLRNPGITVALQQSSSYSFLENFHTQHLAWFESVCIDILSKRHSSNLQ